MEPDYKVEFEFSDAPDYKVEFELTDAVASETKNDNYESATSWGPHSGYENRQAEEAEEVLFRICCKTIQNKSNVNQPCDNKIFRVAVFNLID